MVTLQLTPQVQNSDTYGLLVVLSSVRLAEEMKIAINNSQ